MSIKAGTPCFLSKPGHNNFFYPDFGDTGLTYFEEDLDIEDYEVKTWICGNRNFKAVVVTANSLRDIICMSPARTVVWIDITKTEL